MGEQLMKERLPADTSLNLDLFREKGITHGLVYQYHQVLLLPVDKLPLDVAMIKEAYFFGPAAQLHFYRGPGPNLVCVTEKTAEGGDYLDEKVYLMQNDVDHRPYQTMSTRHYLAYDDDGQAYVQSKRILSVE